MEGPCGWPRASRSGRCSPISHRGKWIRNFSNARATPTPPAKTVPSSADKSVPSTRHPTRAHQHQPHRSINLRQGKLEFDRPKTDSRDGEEKSWQLRRHHRVPSVMPCPRERGPHDPLARIRWRRVGRQARLATLPRAARMTGSARRRRTVPRSSALRPRVAARQLIWCARLSRGRSGRTGAHAVSGLAIGGTVTVSARGACFIPAT